MHASLKKIGFILVLVILLPALAFSVYEVSSLNQNEAAIADIYKRQLDAFLFSINQYSDDVVSSWAGKITAAVQTEQGASDLRSFLDENRAISQLFVADSAGVVQLTLYSDSSLHADAHEQSIGLFNRQQEKIERLQTYFRTGYRKIEGLEDTAFPGQVVMLFVLDQETWPRGVCAIVINPFEFVRQVLAARMQVISEEKFIIAALRTDGDSLVYCTDSLGDRSFEQRASLWLLPEYQLAITPAGETLSELIRQRTFTNLGLVALLDIVLLLGIWWVFRNIRKEIGLAQLKADFVANVSHEIRTPLSLISMFAETLHLGRVASEEKRKQYYSIINQESQRLSGIVNKILNFSQIEAGKRIYHPVPTDLNEIIENVLPSFAFHLQQQGFTLQFLPDESLPIIQADPEAVAEALINLLDNAVKYSLSDKHIEISTGQTDSSAWLAVQDQGIGISKEKQKMIFDKFYRVSEGDVHNTQGAGLGLALVEHIVDAHKGHITLESEIGKGSRFQLIFPINK